MAKSPKKPSPKAPIDGTVVSSVPGFVLVKQATSEPHRPTPMSERASTLAPRLASALSQPGISRATVFKGRTRNVFSYSIDVTDTSRVVRVSADGKRTVGRLVGNRFVPAKAV